MSINISLRHINKLAIPALIAGISEPILSITDIAIVGNINVNATESLAAVGIVGAFISMLIWVLGQTRSAISSIVSQYVGANKLEQIKNLPAQAIFIITALSILIILSTYPFAENIFKLYNASNLILEYSVDYYRIRVFGFPFTLFTIAVFGTFRGLQNTYKYCFRLYSCLWYSILYSSHEYKRSCLCKSRSTIFNGIIIGLLFT